MSFNASTLTLILSILSVRTPNSRLGLARTPMHLVKTVSFRDDEGAEGDKHGGLSMIEVRACAVFYNE